MNANKTLLTIASLALITNATSMEDINALKETGDISKGQICEEIKLGVNGTPVGKSEQSVHDTSKRLDETNDASKIYGDSHLDETNLSVNNTPGGKLEQSIKIDTHLGQSSITNSHMKVPFDTRKWTADVTDQHKSNSKSSTDKPLFPSSVKFSLNLTQIPEKPTFYNSKLKLQNKNVINDIEQLKQKDAQVKDGEKIIISIEIPESCVKSTIELNCIQKKIFETAVKTLINDLQQAREAKNLMKNTVKKEVWLKRDCNARTVYLLCANQKINDKEGYLKDGYLIDRLKSCSGTISYSYALNLGLRNDKLFKIWNGFEAYYNILYPEIRNAIAWELQKSGFPVFLSKYVSPNGKVLFQYGFALAENVRYNSNTNKSEDLDSDTIPDLSPEQIDNLKDLLKEKGIRRKSENSFVAKLFLGNLKYLPKFEKQFLPMEIEVLQRISKDAPEYYNHSLTLWIYNQRMYAIWPGFRILQEGLQQPDSYKTTDLCASKLHKGGFHVFVGYYFDEEYQQYFLALNFAYANETDMLTKNEIKEDKK